MTERRLDLVPEGRPTTNRWLWALSSLLILPLLAVAWILATDHSTDRKSNAPFGSAAASRAALVSPPPPAPSATGSTASRRAGDGGRAVPDADTLAAARELGITPRELWEKRLVRARRTLDDYVGSSKYPPTTRPISEVPDLEKPHDPGALTSKRPLARKDRKVTDAKVTVRQDRLHSMGREPVLLSLECENSDGPQPCEVQEAVARAIRPIATLVMPVVFHDDGQEGDAKPGDRIWSTALRLSESPFAQYHGIVQVVAKVKVGGEDGDVSWDTHYTPFPPAEVIGVKDALVDGSIEVSIGLRVKRPGRYVLRARVDDANGKSFAFLTFNDVLDVGEQHAKLVLFGKLILDTKAVSPFKLRDLEGFLLLENTDPDRQIIDAKLGVFHTTKSYSDADLSSREWQSDEKQRHVDEFSKDVARATEKVADLE